MSVKGVRGFLGFANFYYKKFEWSAKAEEAFRKLKRIFVTAPALAQFDYDKETRIKTDSLG